MRIVILGAGVFGATAALELARRAHDVTLVDPGPIPHPDASSTDISKVVRLDYGADAFYTGLMERALVGWRAFDRPGERSLFHETGFAVLSSHELVPGSFEYESRRLLEQRGHRLEHLAGAQIEERFVELAPGSFVAGYYNPQGGWAESGEVVRRFVERAIALGVSLRSGVRAAIDGDRVALSDGTTLIADAIVVAAGAWTPRLVPDLASALSVVAQPVLHFVPADVATFTAPRLVPWAADIGKTGWYGFCAHPEGVVKVAHHGPGVVVDPAAPRGEVPAVVEARFRAFLGRHIPRLAAAPCVHRRWCCYCDSFDGDPWITRHPTRDKLVIAAGGSGHAFKFAPLLGELVADEVEGVSHPSIAQRFGWRSASTRSFEEARCSETAPE